MELQDKVVLITGAAKGIGLACAEAFAAEGSRLGLVDIDAGIGEVAERLGAEHGVDTTGIVADLSDRSQARSVVPQVVEAFDRVDVLVNNAGIIIAGDILELDEADMDKVLSVNLFAYYILAQDAARQMVAQGGEGNIIHMASTNAQVAIPNQFAYSVAKGGVNMMTRVMAVSLAQSNIRVNAIGPGSIDTDVLKSVMTNDEMRRTILSRTPMGRFGQPSEVASVAVFLASDAASYITGQTIYPDGGRLVLNYTVPVLED
jgi:NAD(P)-dependent dehydrogenase (short-subunit alcohol dehydrogenase family)